MGQLRALTEDGDLKVMWDPDSDDEVSVAKEQFKKLLNKGYKAFAVKKDGEKGKEIKEFDADSGMIIMVPRMAGG
jgi:hypothetical protein